MTLVNDLLFQEVRMANDCKNVVRSFVEEAKGPYDHVIRDVGARQGEFPFFKLIHESRRSNHDAHGLARSSFYASLVLIVLI